MLVEMMKYTQWADAQIIEVFQRNSPIPAKAHSLFNHVLNAQHIWASRILDRASLYAVWEEHSSEALSSVSTGNFELFQYIMEYIALTNEITYTNSNGERYTNTVMDILIHVFNHSTYHRGQIASMLKVNEIQPPTTDYIQLKREIQ